MVFSVSDTRFCMEICEGIQKRLMICGCFRVIRGCMEICENFKTRFRIFVCFRVIRGCFNGIPHFKTTRDAQDYFY